MDQYKVLPHSDPTFLVVMTTILVVVAVVAHQVNRMTNLNVPISTHPILEHTP
jgi:hypothetical protein